MDCSWVIAGQKNERGWGGFAVCRNHQNYDVNTPWEDRLPLHRNWQICSVSLKFQDVLRWGQRTKKKTFQFVKLNVSHSLLASSLIPDVLTLAAAATWGSAIFDRPAFPNILKCALSPASCQNTLSYHIDSQPHRAWGGVCREWSQREQTAALERYSKCISCGNSPFK